MGRSLSAATVALTVAVGVGNGASAADGQTPVLHERIADDPAEDQAMHATLDGFPIGIEVGRGVVFEAPDPRAPPSAREPVYRGDGASAFTADRDTRRPSPIRYDDPFVPSNAPYKRIAAFDAVLDDGSLGIREPEAAPATTAATRPGEQTFFADVIVDLSGAARLRVPSVGPGAHVVRARLVSNARDVPFRLLIDGAENWWLERGGDAAPTRARLVMQLAIAPEAFGGVVYDADWSSLPRVPALPPAIARDVAEVAAALGIHRRMRPRAVIEKLVSYFRSFVEAPAPASARGSVYLDLALGRRGVCRHRAFAFTITAQGLGIPARMVTNEAHAWVEVHDGARWLRVDLGGAGEILAETRRGAAGAYEPPPDPFRWPDGSSPGSADVATAAGREGEGEASSPGSEPHANSAPAPGPVSRPWTEATDPLEPEGEAVDRSGESAANHPTGARSHAPPSVELQLSDRDIRRGLPLHVYGAVSADTQPCSGTAVDVGVRPAEGPGALPPLRTLTSGARAVRLGTVATDAHGRFRGALVVPASLPVGDYEVFTHILGNPVCGDNGD